MPFAFIIVGLVLLVAGVRGTNGQLTTLVKGDITGTNNFIHWILAILLIGSLGYIKKIQPLSRIFLVLIIIVLFLSNKGVFASFNSQLFSPAATPSPTPFAGFGGGSSGGAGATADLSGSNSTTTNPLTSDDGFTDLL